MKKIKKIILTMLIIFSVIAIAHAQNPPHPGGGNPPGPGDPPVGGGAPIDGGLGILIVLGAAYGSRKKLKGF